MTADKRTPQSVNPFNHQPIRGLSLYGRRFGLIYLDPRDHSGLLGLWVFKYTGCFLFHFSLRRESAGGNWLFDRWTCLLSRSNSTASALRRSITLQKQITRWKYYVVSHEYTGTARLVLSSNTNFRLSFELQWVKMQEFVVSVSLCSMFLQQLFSSGVMIWMR